MVQTYNLTKIRKVSYSGIQRRKQLFDRYADWCVSWCYQFFFLFNKRLTELYPKLFTAGFANGNAANFGRKWGKYNQVYTLCQGDITRIEAVTQLPLHKCYLYLAFEQDKAKFEIEQMKKK